VLILVGLTLSLPAPALAVFGVQPGSFDAALLDPSGGEVEQPQAGAHPFALRFGFALNTHQDAEAVWHPDGEIKTLAVNLPPGLLGNLGAASLCAQSDFLPTGPIGASHCPTAAQVGVANLLIRLEEGSDPDRPTTMPIYNLKPPRGVLARVGFVPGAPVVVDLGVSPVGGYSVTATARNLSQTAEFFGGAITLWGVPADAGHNGDRYLTGASSPGDGHGGPLPSGQPRIPFLNNPTRCGVAQTTGLNIDSWQEPGRFLSYLSSPLTFVGCNQLVFEPAIGVLPTTERGDSPSGLDLDLHLPLNEDVEEHEDPDGVATAQLRDATVKLAAGMTVNPAAAGLLGGCSMGQVGIAVNGAPDDAPVTCPASSRLGRAEVVSPAVGHPLPGSVYLATPEENPFGSLLALYLVVDDPASGLLVKLAGRVEPDPRDGQLTVSFEDSPQLPFEDLRLRLFSGPSAVLRTPIECGRYVTTSSLVPWTAPEGAAAAPSSSFQLGGGTAAGSCTPAAAAPPHQPRFTAGTIDPTAGAFAPLVMRLGRSDGSQPLRGVEATLPEGLLAKLDGTPPCPAADLTSAAGRNGAAEQAQPSCPAASRVGRVDIGAGAGPNPLYLTGRAYLAGPYRSAPLSLAIVTPAVAGPFDLGTIVIRVALEVDPATARVHAASGPLPTIVSGIPLDLRSLAIHLDKPGFTVNPTSCKSATIAGTATGDRSQSATLSERFQVDDCGALSFKPRLSLHARGGLGRGGHPSLRAVLRGGPHEAGISTVAIALPPGELLDLRHLGAVCARTLPPQSCPPSSRLGRVRIRSSLVPEPLAGSIYLRTPRGRLPELLADLHGSGFHLVLHGRATSRAGRLGIRFSSIPDAPLSKAVITLSGGPRGIVVNSEPLCGRKPRASVSLAAHNAALRRLRPVLRPVGNC
jgi:hypothetical protein